MKIYLNENYEFTMDKSEVEKIIKNTVRCPIDTTFKIIGKKFTVHILRNMILLNQTRFSQLAKSIEGINTKTLTIRLREMEKDGLVEKTIYQEIPPRVEYTVTAKGRAVEPILEQLVAFSMIHCPAEIFSNKKSTTFEEFFKRKSARIE